MRQLNLTINPGRNYDPVPSPPILNGSSVVAAMPFSKRKFSSITLSSQPISFNTRPVIQSPQPRPTAIRPYTRNVRHVTEANPINVDHAAKMVWGKPTWYLLHTMAEKIRADFFAANRLDVLQTIYTICINLPCPTCSGHAKEYLTKNQFFQVRTKDELKSCLYHFHNAVNARKGVRIFPAEQLSQYSQAIPAQIVEQFLIAYSRKSKNIRLIADDMHRQSVTAQVRAWFQRNIQYFDGAVSQFP